MICDPDIHERDIDSKDEYMVIGCDGIWELQDAAKVCNTVSQKLSSGEKKLSNICEAI